MRTLPVVILFILVALFVSCGADDGGEAAGVVDEGAAVTGAEAPEASADESGGEGDEANIEGEVVAEAEQVEETPSVSYRRDVYPIFDAKCIACHHPNNAVRVILTDIFNPELGMINRPNSWPNSEYEVLVVPGDPDASALVFKIEATEMDPKVDGNPMPWHIPLMTQTDLANLASWIDSGAEDNEAFRTLVAPVFGDGVSLGSRGGKCAYCHHSDVFALEPDLTNVFDPDTGAVNVVALRGGLRIAPGNAAESVLYLRSHPDLIPPELEPIMPRHYARLTPEEISTVREWIALGAQNN